LFQTGTLLFISVTPILTFIHYPQPTRPWQSSLL
jgi:hypothetical protein